MADDPRSIPELSLDTQTMERMLREVPVGGILTYATLSAAIGRDVQHEARHTTRTARQRLLRSDRMLFEPVTNIGLKRLDDAGKVATGRAHLRRSRTQARLAQAKTSAVDDFAALPNHLKVEHNLVLAQAGILRHVTSGATTRKLEKAVNSTNTDRVLPLRQCLDAVRETL